MASAYGLSWQEVLETYTRYELHQAVLCISRRQGNDRKFLASLHGKKLQGGTQQESPKRSSESRLSEDEEKLVAQRMEQLMSKG